MSRHNYGRTPRHRLALRLGVLARTRWRCFHCGAALMLADVLGVDRGWWKDRQKRHGDGLLVATIDHLVPVAVGGRVRAPDNLVASCGPCNNGRADNPAQLACNDRGVATRLRWSGQDFVRSGRDWVPAEESR